MRDLDRIDRILALLARYWRDHPDLRLAQMVSNMCEYTDPYYVEDEDLEHTLRALIAASEAET